MRRQAESSSSEISARRGSAALKSGHERHAKGELTMRKTSFAIMAGALTMALGVLTSSIATAQNSVFVDPNGKVGVGTSSPSAKFHVFENVDTQTYALIENINTGPNAAGISRVNSNTA